MSHVLSFCLKQLLSFFLSLISGFSSNLISNSQIRNYAVNHLKIFQLYLSLKLWN